MHWFFWLLILGIAINIAVFSLGKPFLYLKKCYYVGVAIWSRWLPVFAAIAVLFLTAISITNIRLANEFDLTMNHYYGHLELMIMFLCSPLLFSKYGNLTASAFLIYGVERLIFKSNLAVPNCGLILYISSLTILAVLGDKFPWLVAASPSAARVREILLLSLGLGFISIIAATFIKLSGFNQWAVATFAYTFSMPITLIFMFSVFVGWLTVLSGITKHFSLPLLSIPSLLALAYITSWPSYVLIIPFTLCLSLSLSLADRRRLIR